MTNPEGKLQKLQEKRKQSKKKQTNHYKNTECVAVENDCQPKR